MNAAKLSKLQEQVRIGGKGSARRKRKVVHRTAAADDKKVQNMIKKLGFHCISGTEEVNMFMDDGSVTHFSYPKLQASTEANAFAVTGVSERKSVFDLLPGIVNQLGPLGVLFQNQKRAAGDAVDAVVGGASELTISDEEEIPALVEDFDALSKVEDD